MTFRKISIIGTGLIGGSIALSLKQSKGYDFIITGFDIDPSSLDIALELGAINKKANSIEEAVNDADVVFLCTPIKEILQQIHIVSKHAKSGTIITDVGSVKKIVLKEAEKIKNDVKKIEEWKIDIVVLRHSSPGAPHFLAKIIDA
ncbi:Prephenate dehydrogenase, partial [Candidatus Kryptonium thompsonii]